MARIIKRYENRKLYDVEARRYISLDTIAELIRQGYEVKVVDNKSEADLTAQTLTQIILEEGKKGRTLLSSDTLHDVIRWGSHVLDDGLRQVRQSLGQLVAGPLSGFFQRPSAEEVTRLKERIDALEATIRRLAQSETSKTRPKRKRNPSAKRTRKE